MITYTERKTNVFLFWCRKEYKPTVCARLRLDSIHTCVWFHTATEVAGSIQSLQDWLVSFEHRAALPPPCGPPHLNTWTPKPTKERLGEPLAQGRLFWNVTYHFCPWAKISLCVSTISLALANITLPKANISLQGMSLALCHHWGLLPEGSSLIAYQFRLCVLFEDSSLRSEWQSNVTYHFCPWAKISLCVSTISLCVSIISRSLVNISLQGISLASCHPWGR